jgi:hypothetical protein
MAKKTKKNKRSKRKQPDLPAIEGPGISDDSIPEIDDVASEYVAARDTRMAELAKEVEAKGRLKAIMDKHSRKVYKFDGLIVSIVPGEETIKVKKIKDIELEDGDADQD